MSYLIDTNVISEVRKGDRCNASVKQWFDGINDDELYLSVLVLGEIRKGIERLRSRDIVQAEALENWLTALATSFADRILPVDREVAEEWGRMGAIRPVSTVDAILAATAKVHALTLATRNVADVSDLGADVFNPFETT